MSDDTPTQKFDAAGDAPTERFTAPTADTPSEEVVEERKSRRLIIILASIGGALLIAVIVILILLLTRNSGTPGALPSGSPSASPTPTASATASATPSATPTPTPTQDAPPPPPPPSTDASVDNFGGTNTISCNSQAPVTPDYTLYFEWNTSNGDDVYFGVDTNDASAGALFPNLPADGNSEDDFPYDVEYGCYSESHTYTITVVGDNGTKDSSTITVTNTGDKQ